MAAALQHVEGDWPSGATKSSITTGTVSGGRSLGDQNATVDANGEFPLSLDPGAAEFFRVN